MSQSHYPPTPADETDLLYSEQPVNARSGRQDVDIIKTVKIERDMQGVTVEGFRTLGVVSTFIAGVEAQCFGLVPSDTRSEEPMVKAISALLVIGLLLSSFGAVTALLAARWFDLLKGDEVELLNHRWACARAGFSHSGYVPSNHQERQLDNTFEYTYKGNLPNDSIMREIENCKLKRRNWILAKLMLVPFQFIVFGYYSFITGITLYTWRFQPVGTAAACTIITITGTIVVVCLHLDFETMGALNQMSFRRPRL
ncbi:hypothetical protein RhiJN_24094 [Ceratobasidium sp. AG-Ba]|nr:hypothetical protein RhiJN_24094 [Ceratobasidium sp. AG-Ba]